MTRLITHSNAGSNHAWRERERGVSFVHDVIRDQSEQCSSIFLLAMIQKNLHFKCPSITALIAKIISLNPGKGKELEVSPHLSRQIKEM